jgi:hypothetical protein
MATADQIRAAAAGYAATDDAAAKRLRDAQSLVFGQAAQQVGSVRQAQAAAPQLVQAQADSELKQADQAAQTQTQAGELANQATQQQNQQTLEAQGTAQGLAQTQQAASQQLGEAQAEASQRIRMTNDEQASAARLQQVGLAYDNQLAFLSRKQRDDLAKLGRDVKDRLFTDRLTFEQDEAGRKFANERQLADYTVANAKSEDELRDKLQQVQQAQQRKEYLIERSYELVGQDLDRRLKQAEQERDQVSKAKILEWQRTLKTQEAARAKKAGVMQNVLQGAAGGAMAGAPIAPPWGAIIGGVVGAGAGYAASQT